MAKKLIDNLVCRTCGLEINVSLDPLNSRRLAEVHINTDCPESTGFMVRLVPYEIPQEEPEEPT